jgi:hypothetical protein
MFIRLTAIFTDPDRWILSRWGDKEAAVGPAPWVLARHRSEIPFKKLSR